MNIIIEVTRQCNLQCDHCLRGEPENKSISKKYVDELFSNIERINTLTLSGGESALRPDKIQMILDSAKKYNVDIYNFYIATNGTIASDEFLKVLMELYLYCSDNEISCVDISNDVFHDVDLIEENTKKFQMFSFCRYKYHPKNNETENSSNKFPDFFYEYEYKNLLSQGRGEYYSKRKPSEVNIENLKEYPEDAEFYLNCNGNLILGCDWSYKNQEKHLFCPVSDLTEILDGYLLEDVDDWIDSFLERNKVITIK